MGSARFWTPHTSLLSETRPRPPAGVGGGRGLLGVEVERRPSKPNFGLAMPTWPPVCAASLGVRGIWGGPVVRMGDRRGRALGRSGLPDIHFLNI